MNTTEKTLSNFTNNQKGYKKNTYYLIKQTEKIGSTKKITYIVRQKIGKSTQFVGSHKDFELMKQVYIKRFDTITGNLVV